MKRLGIPVAVLLLMAFASQSARAADHPVTIAGFGAAAKE